MSERRSSSVLRDSCGNGRQTLLRSRFAQINASWAIEGQIVDEADLAAQERIIRGEITAKEAIDELKDRYAIR